MENQICTMKDIVDYAAETYKSQPAIRYKKGKEIISKSFLDLKRDSEAFGRAIQAFGQQGIHVALIGPTSYEWIVSYFGTVNGGNVIIPIDAALPADAVCELIERSDATVFVYDQVRRDAAEMAAHRCPGLCHVISMQAPKDAKEEEKHHVFSELLEHHMGSLEGKPDPDKLCAILFTSGTTGKSKGVMLTHRSLTDNAVCLDMRIPAGTVSMTVLPVHHAYCFTMDILKGIYIGITICINDSVLHFAKNIKLFEPEIMLLVPMIVESVYKKLRDVPAVIPKKLAAKKAFGGKLKTICSGGAYLAPEMVDVFSEYGIAIQQGYGMTECSPVISTNLAWNIRKDSVGQLLPNCEAKTVDGELWVRGSSVMLGYYKMPEETKEALTEDGWLRTGDLGYVDDDRFVYLTGRKKNLIILKNGENVSPEELENELSRSDLVKEVLVREKDDVIEAEIFPDLEYAQKKKVSDLKGSLQGLLDDYNKGLPAYKKIRSLIVRDTEFEKTSSQKIRRF